MGKGATLKHAGFSVSLYFFFVQKSSHFWCLSFYSVYLWCRMWICVWSDGTCMSPCCLFICFLFVSLSGFCVADSVTFIGLNRNPNLLLQSIKNTGLHVYNMDMPYTAKHAGPYKAPLLSTQFSTSVPWCSCILETHLISQIHALLFILFYSIRGQSGYVP